MSPVSTKLSSNEDVFSNKAQHAILVITDKVATTRLSTPPRKKSFKNIVVKAEKCRNLHFLPLFLQCFLSSERQI